MMHSDWRNKRVFFFVPLTDLDKYLVEQLLFDGSMDVTVIPSSDRYPWGQK